MLTPEAVLVQFCLGTGDFENAKKWMSAASAGAPKDLKTRLAARSVCAGHGRLGPGAKARHRRDQDRAEVDRSQIAAGIDPALPEGFRGGRVDFDGVVAEAPHNVAATNNLARR